MKKIIDAYFELTKYPLQNYCNEECTMVYVLKKFNKKVYKIGITNQIERRVNNINSCNDIPYDVILLLTLCPEYDEHPAHIERFLHKYYEKNHIRGEFFILTKNQVNEIYSLFMKIEGDNVTYNKNLFELWEHYE